MQFKVLVALMVSSVLASDCNVASNFPSTLSVGQLFPLVTKSEASPDNSLHTVISSNLKIVSMCSIQLVNLTLSDAPVSAQITLYGSTSTQSYPISATILSGNYTNEAGPVFTLLDTSNFQVSPSSPGIAFSDFTSITVYAVPLKWVIAESIIRPGYVVPVTATTIVPSRTNPVATTTSKPSTVPGKIGSGSTALVFGVIALALPMVYMAL
jgi:hypothetical protein